MSLLVQFSDVDEMSNFIMLVRCIEVCGDYYISLFFSMGFQSPLHFQVSECNSKFLVFTTIELQSVWRNSFYIQLKCDRLLLLFVLRALYYNTIVRYIMCVL